MPATQNSLPFINVNLATDMRKTSLPNLSYPVRSSHTPWVKSSVPLVITKTESLRYQTSFVYSNGSSGLIPTSNDASFELRILKWMKALFMLSKHKLRKVKEGIAAVYLLVQSS